MIKSFGNRDTERLFQRESPRRFRAFETPALKKLLVIHAGGRLNDLMVPPGNRLEKLKGDRAGQYSIRINDRWRVCFRWKGGDAYDVEVVDYH